MRSVRNFTCIQRKRGDELERDFYIGGNKNSGLYYKKSFLLFAEM